MVAVLGSNPAPTEQSKPKPRRGSRGSAAPPSGTSQPLWSGGPALPNDIQISTGAPQAVGEGGQAAPATAQASPEPAPKRAAGRAKPKAPTKEQEKVGAASGEDKANIGAKARAAKALEVRPGFASREDAVFWLRATLDGDPALENLVAVYEQEVNTELVGDADKLIDHSASIRRELARSQFRVLPEEWPGWEPTERELPGLLLAVVLLCLGAPLCYNMLKAVASLRPLPMIKQHKEA
jgi:hypothetical protein